MPAEPAAARESGDNLTAEAKTLLARRAGRLRKLSIAATTASASGHPSTCLSAADLVACLFFREMRFDAKDPHHPGNDRFVLSKGHAAPLLYAAWEQLGVLTEEQVLSLRRIDSPLEGHPTPYFDRNEAATGSLGQGLSIGLGMALSGRLDRAPYRTFVLMGDAEMAEGSVWEAAHLAGIEKLERLVAICDVNALGQSRRTAHGHDTNFYARLFAAFGWRTIEIDGHDLDAIAPPLARTRTPDGRPTAILARTLKGHGVEWMADADGWHGKPVPADKIEETLRLFADDEPLPVCVPPAPLDTPAPTVQIRTPKPADPPYKKGESVATRNAYGEGLARLGALDPRIVALDADTKNSTFAQDFLNAHPDRFFECFIAEQNMVGAAVGLAARGKIPFASTFAAFLTRAYDFIRMAAVGRAAIKLCGSHCGISIGEDGPSQMGLEDLAMMRAIPGAAVLYPSDAVSAERLVQAAAAHDGIAYLRTTRPKLPVLYEASEAFPVGGSKVLRSSDDDKVTAIGAGITLHEALSAAETLAREGIAVRVVDAYSVKPVDSKGIGEAIAAGGGRVVVVEDHYPEGGLGEAVFASLPAGAVTASRHLAVRSVPRSGPQDALLAAFRIDAAAIADAVRELVG